MRNLEQRHLEPTSEKNNTEKTNTDYLRGYRDGIRDRRAASRSSSGDGLLGALLAVALITGVGYLGYNYATTGQLLPAEVELQNPFHETPATP